MTDRRDWQMAFLKQARSDWEAYQRTRQAVWPHCHRLHFLQMATEKLGKALLIGGHSKLKDVTHSHSAFVKFMHIASNNYGLQSKLKMAKLQLKADFSRLLPRAYDIEHLAPALAQDGPNPEYPWLDKSGQIYVPVDYSFPLTNSLQSHQGIKLLKYIEYSLMAFEKLFLS